jgi:hypothetical protein
MIDKGFKYIVLWALAIFLLTGCQESLALDSTNTGIAVTIPKSDLTPACSNATSSGELLAVANASPQDDTTGTMTSAAAAIAAKTTTAGDTVSSSADSGGVSILWNGDSISVDGDGVVVDGRTATITTAGNYFISGTLSDGRIVVDAGDEATVQLILEGVDITQAVARSCP